ncbi:sugar phosphate isomerase/epimerase [Agromyces sp. C10]|uniref:sugar phosphate isomerase/epimerase family protein n=1 Tax=Agromyces sp. C10 TaxID=2935077 RepID=UPI002009F9BF|nr:sugar phosphate isomerase/epimerase family protein [Agromyces sp. C10]MCK8609651.1 sugar phosphate isomerase/epimerase [Agromyces sp. C10]
MDELTEQAEHDARVLGRSLGLTRRQLLAATTGMAAAAAVGLAGGHVHASPAAANPVGNANGVLVPASKRGIILYTVRDAISRDPGTTDLPSGFREVFEELSRIGYRQIEFAGYNQHANAEGGNVNNPEGAKLLRKWLDDNGLEAEGNHGSIPSTLTDATLASFDAACEIANILGLGHIGTGGDPTGSAYLADWQAAADRWNFLGERAATHGLKLYTHNHDIAYSFLLDSGPLDALGRPTRSSGIRRLEWFLANTDPKHVFLEMDIYWAHVAQYKHHTFTAPDGSSVQRIFDPAAVVAAQTKRFPLFHAKDGRKDTTQANGYVMTPFGEGDIDYSTFFRRVGAKGSHNPMWEQDTAPGGGANPGQSLQLAALSYENLAALRG